MKLDVDLFPRKMELLELGRASDKSELPSPPHLRTLDMDTHLLNIENVYLLSVMKNENVPLAIDID